MPRTHAIAWLASTIIAISLRIRILRACSISRALTMSMISRKAPSVLVKTLKNLTLGGDDVAVREAGRERWDLNDHSLEPRNFESPRTHMRRIRKTLRMRATRTTRASFAVRLT